MHLPFAEMRHIEKLTKFYRIIKRQYGWLLAQLHGSLTPAHADGCGAQCFVGVQCASIFDPARVSSPASCHACFAVWCFSLSPHGGHGAPTVWLGTNRNVSVCLILRRWPPNGLSLSRYGTHHAERGTHGGHLNQVRSKSRIAIISFVSSLRRRSSST